MSLSCHAVALLCPCCAPVCIPVFVPVCVPATSLLCPCCDPVVPLPCPCIISIVSHPCPRCVLAVCPPHPCHIPAASTPCPHRIPFRSLLCPPCVPFCPLCAPPQQCQKPRSPTDDPSPPPPFLYPQPGATARCWCPAVPLLAAPGRAAGRNVSCHPSGRQSSGEPKKEGHFRRKAREI